jgi:hypothetical protein
VKEIPRFKIISDPDDDWKERDWNLIFEIIYTQSGEFKTMYVKDEYNHDPYKKYLRDFKDGNFADIIKERKLPLLFLLYNTITSLLIEEIYPDACYLQRFSKDFSAKEDALFQWKSKEIVPLWSIGRDHWFFATRREDQAHRLGYRLSGQCKKLTIIYCKPVHTPHHRCAYPNVEIFSLMEFNVIHSKNAKQSYEKHIIYLINYLYKVADEPITTLIESINQSRTEECYVHFADLREALLIYKLPINNIFDAFYSFASMLILNSWQEYTKNLRAEYKKELKYNKKIYSFKKIEMPTRIHEILDKHIPGIDIFMDENEDLCFIKMFNFQFSFHVVSMDTFCKFINSKENKFQEWTGKRLKPIAPLILNLARKIYYWSQDKINFILITLELYCTKDKEGWVEISELFNKVMASRARFGIKDYDEFVSILKKQPNVFEILNVKTKGIEKPEFVKVKKYKSKLDENFHIYNFILSNSKL